MRPQLASWQFLLLLYLLRGVHSDPDSVSVPFPDGKAPDGTRYKKDYRCESETLTIGCKVHERIRVIRANYGRFSLAICNKHGSTELSVNCMSPQTTGILKAKCDNLSNCTMQVNSHVFGEPCPGVQKYLEVHYACVTTSGLHSGTTPRLPSWLLEGAAGNLWTDNNSKGSEEETENEEEDDYDGDIDDEDLLDYEDDFEEDDSGDVSRRKPILVQATTPVRIPITTPKPTTSTTTLPSPASSEASVQDPGVRVNELAHVDQLEIVSNQNKILEEEDEDGCPRIHARYLLWNNTAPGEISIQPCPVGTSGLARWICNHEGSRETPSPDMSDCKSHSMSELEASTRNEEPESVIASRLSILSGKRFFGGDLETSVSVMKSISNRLQYLIRHKENFYNKASFVSDVFQNIFRSASNLLNNHAVWMDVSETSRRSKIAADMVAVLEDCAFLWADSLEEPEIVYESTNNAVMAISSTLETTQIFPSSPNTPEWFANEDSISLSIEQRSPAQNGGETHHDLSKMVFFSYRDLHRLLPPKAPGARLVSRVISGSVLQHSLRGSPKEDDSLRTTIKFHTNASNPSCSRWDHELGDWDAKACSLSRREQAYIQCSCESPGMFALIAGGSSGGLIHDKNSIQTASGAFSDVISLEIATYVVSIICFLIIVLIIVQFRKQIRRLCQKSTCCCCICLERDSEDKTRDLYTGATLMEAASSSSSSGQQQQHPQPGGNNTTGSSSVSSSSNSSTLPSRMITESSSGSNGGRMSVNTLTIRSRLARESVGAHRAPAFSNTTTTSNILAPHRSHLVTNWDSLDEGPTSPLSTKARRRPSITVNPAVGSFRRRPETSETRILRAQQPQYYCYSSGSFSSSSVNASPSHALHTQSTNLEEEEYDEEAHVYDEILDQKRPNFRPSVVNSHKRNGGGGGGGNGSSSSDDTVSDLQQISDFSDDEGYDLTPRNLIMNDKNLSVVV